FGNGEMVDTVDNVLDIAFARRGQHHTRNAFGLQVLSESFAITPASGVINNEGIGDSIRGVVDLAWIIRVDDLNLHAVSGNGVVLLINGDGAIEGAVNGVAPQQASPLDEVVVAAFTHDNCAESEPFPVAVMGNHNAGK